MKTLAVILHYNTPDIWQQVVQSTTQEECLLVRALTCFYPTERK